MKLTKNKSIFMVGIGGISMSGLAMILFYRGYHVAGSDCCCNENIKKLLDLGIDVKIGHNKNNICGFDVVVYSSAIMDDIPEIKEAKEKGIKLYSRSDLLGAISKKYKRVVAISGSHGKTTTTALVSHIFNNTEKKYTAHVGGVLSETNTSCLINGNDYFVSEACEYKDNFLNLEPNILAILNISLDHVDYFEDLNQLVESFVKLSNNIKDNGYLIVNFDDKNTKGIIKQTKKNKNIITFSLKSNRADYYIKNITKVDGGYSFVVCEPNGEFVNYFSSLFGIHNLYNCLVAIIIANCCGISNSQTKLSLKSFSGVKRRFEYGGEINGASVIFDYAHHPDEISTIISEVKKETKGKVCVCFQPHTYTRTKTFWTKFIDALKLADIVVLYPVYPAREKPIKGVSSKRLSCDLKAIKKNCLYVNNFEKMFNYLNLIVKKEDIVLVLGAGDIIDFKNILKK